MMADPIYIKINDYINRQSTKVVNRLDLDALKVEYLSNVVVCNNRGNSGPEAFVRAYLLTKLVNELGYSPERIELEHKYTAGRPNTNECYSDVIVRDSNGDVFLFFDTKKPNEDVSIDNDDAIEQQLFNVAGMERSSGHNVKYLVLYTIAFDDSNKSISDKCVIIDSTKYTSFAQWRVNREATDTLPQSYGKALKMPYVKASSKDLAKDFSNETLKRLQTNLHNVLWGGGGTDDNEVFSSLTRLILAKIQDEVEREDEEKYEFQVFTYDTNEDEEFETSDKLFERINELYRRALEKQLNIVDKDELSRSYVVDTNKFSLSKLKYAVQELEGFSFVDGKNSLSGKDILGDFFEGIIRDGFKQTKGQFFTHINIVRFMLYAIQADKLAAKRIKNDHEIPYMIDPSAGSGTFLIEYMKFITENMKYRNQNNSGYNEVLGTSRSVRDKIHSDWFYPDNRENRWAQTYIYGCEINFNLGTATKVNMILHGDGSSNIFVDDGLLPFSKYKKEQAPNALNECNKDNLYNNKEVNGKFDLILTNPPFSVELDNDTKRTLREGFLFANKKNSENLFVERWYQLLRENGRLGAILPDSVFDTSENRYIRLFIYKYFKIKAVVSLPKTAFQPYTSTKTSILFAQKKTRKEINDWNGAWKEASRKYSSLRTRTRNLIAVHDGKKEKKKLRSISKLTPEEEANILRNMLRSYLSKGDINLSSDELIDKYRDELDGICKINNDTKDCFEKVNVWWVFGEVVQSLSFNYDIFLAEADNIGYKRLKRTERPAPNDLYRTDDEGNIMIDDDIEETILDYMREIDWD